MGRLEMLSGFAGIVLAMWGLKLVLFLGDRLYALAFDRG